MLRLEDYDFELPPELIAQTPLENRDQSRLLVIDRASGRISHHIFADLAELLPCPALLVANNTRVLRARLLGHRVLPGGAQGGAIEFLMLEKLGERRWEGAFRAAAKQIPGVQFKIPTPDGKGVVGTIVVGTGGTSQGTVVAEFDRDPAQAGAGQVPLPPYIERSPDESDLSRYQTVYATQSEADSAAAPTAGLHFTPELISKIRARGIGWTEVRLSVGLGTFRPVKTDDIREHRMHEEAYDVPAQTAAKVAEARAAKTPVIGIGTTSVRTLESAWDSEAQGLRPGPGRTSIFIYPGYSFKTIDQMITNFHLPKSTLFMMVCALGGAELMREAYAKAIESKYRFFSYGDAMWIR